jgi:CheY-like chemotaxis protein
MKTVLIVDDEPLFLESLIAGLAAFASEFSVVTAHNGAEAAEVLRTRHVDLVVTDLKMPVMDGFQLLAYMIRRHPLVPAIVMTAFGTPSIEEQLRSADAFGYLEKPIDFQALTDRIRAGLDLISRGHLHGITLFSFLQLLNVEQKTCSLRIVSGGREGYLYLIQGEIAHATFDDVEGEAAAHAIVCWQDADIEIVDLFKKVKRTIEIPLQNLLMDAAQITDEQRHDAPALEAHDAGETHSITPSQTGELPIMASNVTQSLDNLMQIDGALATALVDAKSGMMLGSSGGGNGINLEVAAAGNSEVIRSKLKVMQNLGLRDRIEDILISLGNQYHLIRPVGATPHLFYYLVLNRAQSNLAMARHKLSEVEATTEV